MNMIEIQQIIETQLLGLKDEISLEYCKCEEDDEYDQIRIYTPYHDGSYPDCSDCVIEVYIPAQGDELILSDNGVSRHKGKHVEKVIKDFGIGIDNSELILHTTKSNFSSDFLKFVVALSILSYLPM